LAWRVSHAGGNPISELHWQPHQPKRMSLKVI
jgi:hypothetical protein